ncbi:MAG TPA: hypothetical protein VK494_03275 [Gemmatimonadaceae bacterium]|nr:hypothetical protein [Gemmatimonadaceae bacterium]
MAGDQGYGHVDEHDDAADTKHVERGHGRFLFQDRFISSTTQPIAMPIRSRTARSVR